MLESFRNKKIMVVAAHPDDELLGLGATMHRLIKHFNVRTHVVILGEGITSRADNRDTKKWEKELSIHQENIKAAQAVIGYHSVSTYHFPDNRFDTVALLDIIKVVEKEKKSFQPEVIFTHHGGDLNIDHQRTFEAVITATRPIEGELVKTIVTFETPSGTEWQASSDPRRFVPNLFIEITDDDLRAKIKAMECYEFEKRSWPHPRSPKGLKLNSQYVGMSCGCFLSERFNLVRNTVLIK